MMGAQMEEAIFKLPEGIIICSKNAKDKDI
jgi:hypothetical protein